MPKRKLSLVFGNLIELAGMLFGISMIVLAPAASTVILKFIQYLLAWFCLLFFPHGLTHYLVGELVGVRFQYYTFGRSSVSKLGPKLLRTPASKLIVLTLRVDQSSLRSVSNLGRGLMFSSGAVASMVLPFIAAISSFGELPWALSFLLLLLSAANLTFDLYYSPKAGDIYRARSASHD